MLQSENLRSAVIDRAVDAIARGSSLLYEVEHSADNRAEHLQLAVEALSEGLGALQTDTPMPASFDQACGDVARALALLYPAVQAHTRPRRNVMFHSAAPTVSDSDAGRGPRTEPLAPSTAPLGPPPGRQRLPSQPDPAAGQRRRAMRSLIEVDIGVASQSHFYAGLSHDMSTGGVFVATEAPRNPGTPVTLYFALPSGQIVEAKGTVAWTRPADLAGPAGMGVRFEDLAPEELQAIEAFCANGESLHYS